MKNIGEVLGIDLGNTECRVSVFSPSSGQEKPLEFAFPTSIFIDNVGKPVVGSTEKEKWKTIFNFKRLFGLCSTTMNQTLVITRELPYKFILDSNMQSYIDYSPLEDGKTRRFALEELFMLILSEAKRVAEVILERNISNAIISIPSNYCDYQRRSLLYSAELAGIHVLKLVHDSSALLLSRLSQRYSPYSLLLRKRRIVTVIDIGNSGIRTAIFSIERSLVTTLASAGYSTYGSGEIDRKLAIYCSTIFLKEHKMSHEKISCEEWWKLQTECERVKCKLSETAEEVVSISDFIDGKSLSIAVTREIIVSLLTELMVQTKALLDKIFLSSLKNPFEVDEIIFAGKASATPCLRQLICGYFQTKEKVVFLDESSLCKGNSVGLRTLAQGIFSKVKESNFRLVECCPNPLKILMFNGITTACIGVLNQREKLPLMCTFDVFNITVNCCFSVVDEFNKEFFFPVYCFENDVIADFDLGGENRKKCSLICYVDENGLVDLHFSIGKEKSMQLSRQSHQVLTSKKEHFQVYDSSKESRITRVGHRESISTYCCEEKNVKVKGISSVDEVVFSDCKTEKEVEVGAVGKEKEGSLPNEDLLHCSSVASQEDCIEQFSVASESDAKIVEIRYGSNGCSSDEIEGSSVDIVGHDVAEKITENFEDTRLPKTFLDNSGAMSSLNTNERAEHFILGVDWGKNCRMVVLRYVEGEALQQVHSVTRALYVALDENFQPLFGESAKNRLEVDPSCVYFDLKRFLGRSLHSPVVINGQHNWMFSLVDNGDGGLAADIVTTEEPRKIDIEEILALYFADMKTSIEANLQKNISRNVVTIPACFGDAQRRAILSACNQAGMQNVHLVTEAASIAVVYQYYKTKKIGGSTIISPVADKKICRNLLVFHCGNSTTESTVFQLSEKPGGRVVATAGCSYLGGEDMDSRIASRCIRKLKNYGEQNMSNKTTFTDFAVHPLDMFKLREAAEKAKQELSFGETATLMVRDWDGTPNNVVSVSFSKEELISLCKDAFERAVKTVDDVLNMWKICCACETKQLSDCNPHHLDDVVLFGGMSKIPHLYEMIQSRMQAFAKEEGEAFPIQLVTMDNACNSCFGDSWEEENAECFTALGASLIGCHALAGMHISEKNENENSTSYTSQLSPNHFTEIPGEHRFSEKPFIQDILSREVDLCFRTDKNSVLRLWLRLPNTHPIPFQKSTSVSLSFVSNSDRLNFDFQLLCYEKGIGPILETAFTFCAVTSLNQGKRVAEINDFQEKHNGGEEEADYLTVDLAEEGLKDSSKEDSLDVIITFIVDTNGIFHVKAQAKSFVEKITVKRC